MSADVGYARQGIVMGLAGIEAGLVLTTSVLRHAGWWLSWHTRGRPSDGCRGLHESDLAPDLEGDRRAA
jgi:hypothetical protein